MTRPHFPLTPGSSSDIKGKDGIKQLSSLHLAFELPPPAIHDVSPVSPLEPTADSFASSGSSRFNSSSSSRAAAAHAADTKKRPSSPGSLSSFAYPMQPAETAKSRRRSSAAGKEKEKEKGKNKEGAAFALPPPPTRSRKIIQMKPGAQEEVGGENSAAKDTGKTGTVGGAGKGPAAAKAAAAAAAGGGAQGKKKQPSATSAAGRKIARKTAHSLIERRRRSKMNEEFAVLKDMIPACTGEMHKLAILQASIDYVRYLEDCVSKLKAHHEENSTSANPSHNPLPPIREFYPKFHKDPADDVEMAEPEGISASPVFAPCLERYQEASVSPALLPQHQQQQHQQHHQQQQHHQDHQQQQQQQQQSDARNRQHSFSSVSTDHRHYSYSTSAGASPALGPQMYGSSYAQGSTSGSGSTLTSPALRPQSDLDQEATAALLMLNHDRRGMNSSAAPLSVRDLLGP